MKSERLLDALEKIDEELIEEAAPGNKPPKQKAKNAIGVKWGAMAACVCLIVGIGAVSLLNYDGVTTGGEPETEGNFDTTGIEGIEEEAGVGEDNLVTLTYMEEIKVRIDEMLPDGFIGTIEIGNDLFKVGKQISIIAQDNVTVVQKDGSIFDYDELEPNIPESDLKIGSSVWVGFQKYDYIEGNGKYNQIFAYHIAERNDGIAVDGECMEYPDIDVEE